MVKFLKPGKVVIVLNGKHAGRKAVIVKNFDEGTDKRKYGHALVAGIERYPLKVTKSMTRKTIMKRSKVKPFVKYVNYNHLMPTRYGLDVTLPTDIAPEAASAPNSNRTKSRASVKKIFEERYKSGKNRWFFTKLRF
eukprot:CAMPEP_0168545470 /NCGR_PEP_ID=MMETSP0413-20121227/2980_1 /TAXON_ID=136452 /ORGANISM="Filamoeba nolandi, Strain NC-AS-23-1" /LENGTH=136 /DNA_ID=CAMNT_0008575579 /DNA_START=69 /DNA_END=479 /DNA_ORIENTATION=-